MFLYRAKNRADKTQKKSWKKYNFSSSLTNLQLGQAPVTEDRLTKAKQASLLTCAMHITLENP